ncbi:MAG TPA: DUF5615 family PIN-like protein [Allosphingosinicella sp.]|jgi:predicted nuclease of predicted toxin-antitoxin system
MAFPIRFLIDECVTPLLANDAKLRGFDAWHVNDRALRRTPDDRIFKTCQAEGLTLVTNNGRDFLPLFAGAEVHSGLIILLPVVEIVDQRRLFEVALDWIGRQPDLVNKVIEIGADASLRVSDIPAS